MTDVMEQLIKEIEEFSGLLGKKPGTVLQNAGGLGGRVWASWVGKTASCTLPMADRIRRYMADNWPAGTALPPHLQAYAKAAPTNQDAA
jgi:hypothetical protein